MCDIARGTVDILRRRRTMMVAAATLAVSTPLMGQSQVWVGPAGGVPGSYLEPLHWNPALAPTATTDAEINNGLTALISAGDAAESNRLVLGRSAGESGTLEIGGGTFALTELRVGGLATDNTNTGGTGAVVQTGGVVTVNTSTTTHGVYIGDGKVPEGNTAVGSYSISGGELHAGTAGAGTGFLIVGTGKGTVATLTQTAGLVEATGYTQVARSGAHATYNMSGGTFLAGTELNVGDGQGDTAANAGSTQGTFIQSGGAASSLGVVVVGRRGGNGSYSLTNAATLTADGQFNVGGLNGTDQGGIGTFTQSGTSVVTPKQNMYVGAIASVVGGTASGSYTLNGGTINAGTATGNRIVVGDGVGATGTFAQLGGAVNVAGLLQVGGGGGSGTYTMSGGQITGSATVANTGLWVGGGPSQTAGIGTFTMSGDVAAVTATFGGDINVGRGSSPNTASGTLNLNGGTLRTNRGGAIGFYVGGGSGSMGVVNQDGGNVNVAVATSGIEVGNNNGSGTYHLISGDLKAPLMRMAGGTGVKAINFSGGTSTITNMNLNNGTMTISGGIHAIGTLTTNSGTLFVSNTSPGINNLVLSSTSLLRSSGTSTLGGTVTLGTATAQVDDGTLLWSGPVNRSAAGTFTKTGAGALTISGPQSYSSAGTSYTVNNGTLNLNSNGGRNLTVHANSTVNFGATQTLAAVNVSANVIATVLSGGGSNRVLDTNALTINSSGGKLDLRDNKLRIPNGVIGTPTGTTYSGITGLIQSGRNGGSWNGSGITTSMPEAQTGLTSLGIKTATSAGTFGGVSVAAGDVLVMYTYGGDANLDGFVSGDDYTAIDFAIAVPGASGWANGDFNYDGIISADDYTVIDFNIAAQGCAVSNGRGGWGVGRFGGGAGAGYCGIRACGRGERGFIASATRDASSRIHAIITPL